MTFKRFPASLKLTTLLAAVVVLAASDLYAAEATYPTLLSRYGRTVVSVNYVLSSDAAGGAADQRIQGETEATLVSADGLLMVPSSVLNPGDLYQKIYRNQGEAQPPAWRSSELKVRLPGSDQPLEASVETQDRDLGVAWLRIKNPPANLSFVDLSKATDPRVGQRAYVVSVVAEEFDYAPYLEETRVQGKIEVPYRAFITDQPGKMLFSTDGTPLGFAVLRIDGAANMSTGGNYRMFATVVGGERLRELQQRVLELARSQTQKSQSTR